MRKSAASAELIVARGRARRCGCATSRLRSTTGRLWSLVQRSRSCPAKRCWSRANREPARALSCAPSRVCGRGAKAISRCQQGRICSCCRSGHMCRPARCDGLPTIPTRPIAGAWRRSRKSLKKVGLGHLVERLDEEGPWDQTLSGGEKQRLAFARIFLHRPDIIVLDEATAALDSQSQDQLMELLSREFEEATIVSVGHRSRTRSLS